MKRPFSACVKLERQIVGSFFYSIKGDIVFEWMYILEGVNLLTTEPCHVALNSKIYLGRCPLI